MYSGRMSDTPTQMVLDGERRDSCFRGTLTQTFLRKPKPAATMPDTPPDHTDFIHSEDFLRGLMKRQLKLSITCASAFLLLLFGLPLMNYLAPELMARRVGGFTLSWLVLGILFFPYVWIIAKWFINRSIALENDEVRVAAEGNKRKP
jgi:uncharacterized membrane protein (DUF485 family)